MFSFETDFQFSTVTVGKGTPLGDIGVGRGKSEAKADEENKPSVHAYIPIRANRMWQSPRAGFQASLSLSSDESFPVNSGQPPGTCMLKQWR